MNWCPDGRWESVVSGRLWWDVWWIFQDIQNGVVWWVREHAAFCWMVVHCQKQMIHSIAFNSERVPSSSPSKYPSCGHDYQVLLALHQQRLCPSNRNFHQPTYYTSISTHKASWSSAVHLVQPSLQTCLASTTVPNSTKPPQSYLKGEKLRLKQVLENLEGKVDSRFS